MIDQCKYCSYRSYGTKLFWKILKHKKIIRGSECCHNCMAMFFDAASKYSPFYCNHCGKLITPHDFYSEQWQGYFCRECTDGYNEFLTVFNNK